MQRGQVLADRFEILEQAADTVSPAARSVPVRDAARVNSTTGLRVRQRGLPVSQSSGLPLTVIRPASHS